MEEKVYNVYTGPVTEKNLAFETSDVIKDMIKDAKYSIWIITYWLGDGAGDLIEEIAEKSGTAKISFVLDDGDENPIKHQVKVIKKHWKLGAPAPKIYKYQGDASGKKLEKPKKMHAKFILCDNRDLLVGSANFTGLATNPDGKDINENFEYGIRIIGGKAPRNASDLLHYFLQKKWFDAVPTHDLWAK